MSENHDIDSLLLRVRELEEQLISQAVKRNHDLNNKLMAMRGHLYLARLETPDKSTLMDRLNHVQEALDEAIAISSSTRTGPVPASPAATLSTPDGGCILIVEDDPLMREMLRLTLTKIGYKTLVSGEGNEALQLFRSSHENIRLVLLDLTLPTISGIETFALMRALQPALRGLLISGYIDPNMEKEALKNGFSGFIPKPCEVQHLVETVKQHMSALQDAI